MTFSQLARLYGGVAYREEDRGDGDTGTGGEDDAAKAERVAAEAKEAETKAAADKAAADAKAEREKGVNIPKDRFDAAVKKEREATEKAEKRAAEAEAKLQKQSGVADLKKISSEIDDLETLLEAKMTEGTPEERKALRAQIREKNSELARAEAKTLAAQATALAVEQVRYDGVVDRMEADYPFLVAGSDEFNEVITGELLELKAAFEAAGMASSEALKKAAKTLKPALDSAKKALAGDDVDAEKKAEEAAQKAAKEAADKAAAKGDEAAKKIAEEAEKKRREEAVKKGLDAKSGQPAAKPGAAGTGDKDIKDLKVSKMSDKDFDALPEAELKRLRGDA